MNSSKSTARRAVPYIAAVTGLAMAAALGVRLASYNVPTALLVACSSAMFTAIFAVTHQVLNGPTTYRCTAGCDFQVRLWHVDTAEARRWQEIAADHPSHAYRP